MRTAMFFSVFMFAIWLSPAFSQDKPIGRFTFSEIHDNVKDSVVTLEVEATVVIQGRPQSADGSGSGVVWGKDGYIVTNKHVIQEDSSVNGQEIKRRARKVYVVSPTGIKITATIVGVAPDTDLALIKINEESVANFKAMEIGDSDSIRVGEHVLAIGSPFGLGGTLTSGIVSSVRSIDMNGSKLPHQMIQTDAAINPGNSGGALVNLDGELVGIPTMIISRTGSNAGIGFAIPSNVVKKIVEDIKNEKTSLGYLGINVQNVNELSSVIRKQLGLQDAGGVMVTSLVPDGPSANSGISQGDIILSVNAQEVKDDVGFRWLERSLSPGKEAFLEIKKRTPNAVEKVKIVVGENKEADTL